MDGQMMPLGPNIFMAKALMIYKTIV